MYYSVGLQTSSEHDVCHVKGLFVRSIPLVNKTREFQTPH